jgi:hypothetical protein
MFRTRVGAVDQIDNGFKTAGDRPAVDLTRIAESAPVPEQPGPAIVDGQHDADVVSLRPVSTDAGLAAAGRD